MSIHHTFDVSEAEKYGLQQSIILYNMRFWLSKNKANKKNIHDNFVWTYNSAKAFEELFPYMKKSSIARYLKELEDIGVLKSSNYNKSAYDRTKWYTIPREYAISHNDSPICQNEKWICQNERPIPDSKPDHKPIDNIYITKKTKNVSLVDYSPSDSLKELAIEKGWDKPESVLEEFKDYHVSRGTKLKDVEAALRTWLRNGLKFKKHYKQGVANYDKSNKPAAKADAWERYLTKRVSEVEEDAVSNGSDFASLCAVPRLINGT